MAEVEVQGEPAKTARGFLQRAEALLTDLLEVKVVTGVGAVDVKLQTTNDSTSTTLTTDEPVTQSIVTVVKLTDGDITTIFAPELVENADLRAFHAEQVTRSLTVLPDNLERLVAIARSLLASA